VYSQQVEEGAFCLLDHFIFSLSVGWYGVWMMHKYIIRLLDWCKVNILLLKGQRILYFKEDEIWWCNIGLNIGEEEFGKGPTFERPVFIFKKLTKSSFLGLPLTGRKREGSWYVPIVIRGRSSSLMLNQARVFDQKRLRRRIVVVNQEEVKAIKARFRELYCPVELITPHLGGETGIGGKSQIVL
jgi:mRNA-degrading endonuclease toxin of MazEF toxin-antitoxin module